MKHKVKTPGLFVFSLILTCKKNCCSDLPRLRVHPADHLHLDPLQHPQVLRSRDNHPLSATTGRNGEFQNFEEKTNKKTKTTTHCQLQLDGTVGELQNFEDKTSFPALGRASF